MDTMTPDSALEIIETLACDFERVDAEVPLLDCNLMALRTNCKTSKRLAGRPGIGLFSAVFLSSKVNVANGVGAGQDFAIWLDLTPKNHSTADKNRLGIITRAGHKRLHNGLVADATAVIAYWRHSDKGDWPWLEALINHKPAKLAAVELANTMRGLPGG